MKDTNRDNKRYMKELVTTGINGFFPFRPFKKTWHEVQNCLHKETQGTLIGINSLTLPGLLKQKGFPGHPGGSFSRKRCCSLLLT